MGLQLTVEKGVFPGRGLGKYLQMRVELDVKKRKKELEKKQERRRARLNGGEGKWEPITFSHLSKTFVSGGTIYPERKMSRKETAKEMSGNMNINTISEKEIGGGNLSGICLFVPGNVLNNWTVKEIPVVYRANSE
ncbi:hypothetical protein PVK06_020802 [Gossypium arboreum]|uniref:Uncharacterized protein n=1 Tax=Gossypium arboreum TaxID=29729 RepID=A0ABR0PNC1_GOSAR|nr:hypothetical protein PVK06_020802 [Gossypium arboreum]